MNEESDTRNDQMPGEERRWAKAKEAGHEAADALRGGVRRMGEEVRTLLAEQARRQQRHAADIMGNCGTVFHNAADQSRRDGDHITAALIASAKLAQGSRRLEHSRTSDLSAGVSRAIKDHPEITLGALFGAGVLLGGLVKSPSENGSSVEGSAPREHHQKSSPPGVPTTNDLGEPSQAHEQNGGL